MPLRNPHLALKPVLNYHNVAVFTPDLFPGAPLDPTLEALCERPLVLLTRESATRRSFDEALAEKGLHPKHVLEVATVHVQKAMIRAGLGAGILPGYAMEPSDGLLHLPILGSHQKSLALCWLKARPLSPAAAAMERLLQPKT